MERKPGDKLGPYELVSAIGRGGMGEVWKARDTRLGRDVAIKISEQRFTDRFAREARAIAVLNHPNICTLYDVGPDYLVMEYIDGTPPRGPLNAPEAVRLALGIAAALEAAHDKGITHRDLKPANILVARSGIKLLDFGLALVNDNSGVGIADAPTALSVAGAVMGTVAYMSPEQAQGKPADARSDIFSFGLVLYEILSGRQAFAGNSIGETLAAILRDEPAPLVAPAKLSEIVMRCLAKDPRQRFQTATELRSALGQCSAKPADREPSIAVLPFANMSGDKEQEYFSDGLAEEIINALAQVPGLKVTARTSAFSFRGKEQDIRRIAEALGVRTILEGSVRRSGERIRVTAQLINASDGYHLWSQRYDREMRDVFEVQDEIAAAIAGALRVKLGESPERYRPSPSAYEAYLKGRHHLNLYTPGEFEQAREYLEESIALDANYALPHYALAVYYFDRTTLGWFTAAESVSKARTELDCALELDPALPEAHAVLGSIIGAIQFDWASAEQEFRRAMTGEAVSADVRLRYAQFLRYVGRITEAVEQARQVLAQDPLNTRAVYVHAWALWRAGRGAESLNLLKEALKRFPHFLLYHVMALAQFFEGRLEEAIESVEKAAAPASDKVHIAILAGLLTVSGKQPDRLRDLLNRLDEPGEWKPASLALYHVITGDAERAVEWMMESARAHYPATMPTLVLDFGGVCRRAGNWPALVKLLNLPETAL